MAERYDGPPGNAPLGEADPSGCGGSYEWIGEWLCEYVDGTMDPSMQAVFEEYIEANPDLAAHVERLCRTRSLLSDCECREQAAERVKERLHRAKQDGRLEQASREIEEQVREAMAEGVSSEKAPFSGDVPSHESLRPPALSSKTGTVLAVASAMTVMLSVGMVAGATLFSDASQKKPVPAAVTPEPSADRAPDRPSAPPHRITFGGTQAASSWAVPPLPLKKMPVRTDDSAHSTSTSLQHTTTNP
jgi:anti-sigma factor RsiW